MGDFVIIISKDMVREMGTGYGKRTQALWPI